MDQVEEINQDNTASLQLFQLVPPETQSQDWNFFSTQLQNLSLSLSLSLSLKLPIYKNSKQPMITWTLKLKKFISPGGYSGKTQTTKIMKIDNLAPIPWNQKKVSRKPIILFPFSSILEPKTGQKIQWKKLNK